MGRGLVSKTSISGFESRHPCHTTEKERTNVKTSEHLRAAKALLADPAGWTQGIFYIQETPKSIARRCALGGIYDSSSAGRMQVYRNAVGYVATPSYDHLPASKAAIEFLAKAIDELGFELPSHMIAYYNNHHTHAEVMTAFNRAIELAEADENWKDLVAAESTATTPATAPITTAAEIGAPVTTSLVRG